MIPRLLLNELISHLDNVIGRLSVNSDIIGVTCRAIVRISVYGHLLISIILQLKSLLFEIVLEQHILNR